MHSPKALGADPDSFQDRLERLSSLHSCQITSFREATTIHELLQFLAFATNLSRLNAS